MKSLSDISFSNIAWYTWVLIIFCVATAVVTAWYWFRRKAKNGRKLKIAALWVGTGAVLMGAFNSAGLWVKKEENPVINLIHIHGINYSKDGSSVMLATHDGIKRYVNGKWVQGEGEAHDYVGYAPFEAGFYSSGHPKAGSALENPLGLIKSVDEGKTIQIMSLHGKVKLQLLAASYRSPILYAINPEPNEGLHEPGLYRTADEGVTWTKSEMNGFSGVATALAVHPDNGGVVAVGSKDGLYLSMDYGKTFGLLLKDTAVSALSFDRDGSLSVGSMDEKPILLQLDPTTGQHEIISLPYLKSDAIAFTAHHPVNLNERIISTYEQDVYLTQDGGETWTQLADNGKTKTTPIILPKATKQPQ